MIAEKTLKVLQLTQYLGGGGLERVVATLATHMDRRRFEPTVMCLRDGGDFVAGVEAEGIPVVVADRDPDQRDLGVFRSVRRVVRDRRIDVIHSHNTEAFVQGALAATALPDVKIVHTDHARDFPDKLIWHVAEHLASWRASWVVGVSDYTTTDLERYPRISRTKLVTVPNGIDGRAFEAERDRQAVRAELGLSMTQPVAGLAVARFTPQKGLDMLVDAFGIVRTNIPDSVLVIAGDAEGRSALEARVAAAGLEGAVRFLGRRSDIPQVFAALDVYVLSSVWEGLPMAILEAMAAGLPVVATAVGGVPTAVRDGVNGFLVPPREARSMGEAMTRLLADARLRGEMGASARETFRTRFTAEAMTRTYERLYTTA